MEFVVIVPIYTGSGRPYGPMRAEPASQHNWDEGYDPSKVNLLIQAETAEQAVSYVWENLVVIDDQGRSQWR